LLAGLQAVLDGGGQLSLAGVVRDSLVDLGGQGLIVRPDRPDQALAGAWPVSRERLPGELQPLADGGAAAGPQAGHRLLAAAREEASARAMLPSAGNAVQARLVPAMTENRTPSRTTSTAAAVAARASAILVCGYSIDPEQSMMMISALPSGSAPAGPDRRVRRRPRPR
jgi:hypothetical protein